MCVRLSRGKAGHMLTEHDHVFGHKCYFKEDVTPLLSALAERAQEIERLKGAAESDAEEYIKAVQVVGEMTEQIHALTARAEAAEAGGWKAIGELFKTGGMNDPAFLVGQVTAEHEQLQAAEAKLKERAG